MKAHSKFAFTATFMLFLGASPVVSANYQHTIIHPPEPGRILKPALQDAAETLGKITGKEFFLSEGTAANSGIVLALSSDESVPEDIREKLAEFATEKEPFYLRSTDPETLLVVANDERGLAHGLYSYLHRIGCSWHLPGANWEILPKTDDVTVQVDEFVAPDFRARDFFGTGGFGIRTPVDPDMVITPDYERWRARNLWGGEFTVGGHAWEGFVTQNEELFRDRPEFRAERNGKRDNLYREDGKLREQVKFCVSNEELTNLFAEHIKQIFRDRPHFPAASIEVADGGGHCECKDCLAIGNGSISDRIFDFANRVTAQVTEEFPDKILTHYAYHEHADIPSFDLHPNLYVQVIPTAFQSTRYSPVELLEVWGEKKKGRNLGTYDYWILPDSNRDMPNFDYLHHPARTLRMWKNAGLDSFNAETTSGAGPMGIGLYLTSRLAWDVNFDVPAAMDEFYKRHFGAAAGPMKSLLERWSNGFYQLPEILGASYADMQAALDAAADEPADIRARVLDFANYLHFIRLYTEYRQLPIGDSDRSKLAREAVKHMWRNYHSYMVHVFRVQWMIRLNDEKDQEWIQEFDMRSPEEKGWAEVMEEGPVRSDETFAYIAEGLQKYGPSAAEFPTFSSDLVPLENNNFGTNEMLETAQFQTYGYTRFTIVVPEGRDSLRIEARALAPSDERRPPIRVRFFNNTELRGGPLVEEELTTEWREITLPTATPGTYELLTLSMANLPFEIRLPKLPTAVTKLGGYGPGNQDLYFYVPAGTEKVIFRTGTVPGGTYRTTVLDEAGSEVSLDYHQSGNDHWFVAENPDPSSGKIWMIQRYRNLGSLEMITVPQSLALTADTLLVPKELVER